MGRVFDAYQKGQQGGMSRGMNMLSMEQLLDAKRKDTQMRNALSQAVTPAMDSAPAMGPYLTDEVLQDYPAQPAQFNVDEALTNMAQGGFGPEALDYMMKLKTMKGSTPSAVNEYEYWKRLDEAGKEDFLNVKRAQKYLDFGGYYGAPSHSDPMAVKNVGERTLKPAEEHSYIEEKQRVSETGKETGVAQTELARMQANLPRLFDVTKKLSVLGKTATYTKAGILRDQAIKEAGAAPTKGAIARTEYVATVNNEILPLLRQTFGAAFTAQEGESLKATLGDPNASPAEKDAVLRAFIETKAEQVKSTKRLVQELKQPGSSQKYKVGGIVVAPNGQRVVIRSLKPDGTPDDVDVIK